MYKEDRGRIEAAGYNSGCRSSDTDAATAEVLQPRGAAEPARR